MLVQPVLELQILSHWSGSEQATYYQHVSLWGTYLKYLVHLICKQDPGCHSWKDEQEQRQEFQKGSQNTSSLGMAYVFGGQCSLDYHLVSTPIPDGADEHSCEKSSPWKVSRSNIDWPQEVHEVFLINSTAGFSVSICVIVIFHIFWQWLGFSEKQTW